MERLKEIINRKPSQWRNLNIKNFEDDITLLQKACQELVIRDEYVKHLEEENSRLKRDIVKSNAQNILYP